MNGITTQSLEGEDASRITSSDYFVLTLLYCPRLPPICGPANAKTRLGLIAAIIAKTDCRSASRYSAANPSSCPAKDLHAPTGCSPIQASSYPNEDNPTHTSAFSSRFP